MVSSLRLFFIRKCLVEWRMVVPMLLIAVIASPLGVQFSRGLDRNLLLWLFVFFLFFASLMMMFNRPNPRSMGGSMKGGLMFGLPVGAIAGHREVARRPAQAGHRAGAAGGCPENQTRNGISDDPAFPASPEYSA
ncbi:TSUP family transporter [Accumulibacter sp.]|uniref:TSUP family transporter n=1 Tax=Accumulibacter sp. TaxID=2053492 RepID=UPI002B67887C|nr:TSUP family transporter [Accumulibacter sp.]HPU81881.1 TSUP family transporter [Accumulibacter sp.]